MNPRPIPIADFAAALRAIPEREFGIGTVLDFLRGHPVAADSLEPYVFFSRNHYTRNLIYRNDLFELLTICWEVGQVSSIHNHQGQNCWMVAPIGRLRVQNFEVVEEDPARGHCRLKSTTALDMGLHEPAEVDPAAPVHQVLNLPEFGARAVSLHIYSRPFDRCMTYEPERNRCREIGLRYHSERGKLTKRAVKTGP